MTTLVAFVEMHKGSKEEAFITAIKGLLASNDIETVDDLVRLPFPASCVHAFSYVFEAKCNSDRIERSADIALTEGWWLCIC